MNFVAAQKGIVQLQILDITGKVMMSESKAVTEGNNNISLSQLNQLGSGIYFLSVELNGKREVSKLIKQ